MAMSEPKMTVVVEPDGNEAGVGVLHVPDTRGPIAEYQIIQMWPGGDSEPVHVGDREDALALIAALADAVAEGGGGR